MLPSFGSSTGTTWTSTGSLGASSELSLRRGSSSGDWPADAHSVSEGTEGASSSLFAKETCAPRKMMADTKLTRPVRTAMNVKNPGMSSVCPSAVNTWEARRERKRGERPKMAILVPEAMPMYCGKDFVAANTREK